MDLTNNSKKKELNTPFVARDEIRKNLAYAYRILGNLGWDDHTYTHLSSRTPDGNSFFIYPFGLRFNEVTPANLMRVSLEGEILEGDEFQYNRTGYVIHGTLYKARHDIRSIIHLHTPEIVAVSACKKGLLPLSQWALHFYDGLTYHDYDSLALDPKQGGRLSQDLGHHYTMLLRNHGSLTCGRTIQEALFYTYHLQKACETQCHILAMNTSTVMPPPKVREQSVHDLLSFERNLGERDWAAWVREIDKSNPF